MGGGASGAAFLRVSGAAPHPEEPSPRTATSCGDSGRRIESRGGCILSALGGASGMARVAVKVSLTRDAAELLDALTRTERSSRSAIVSAAIRAYALRTHNAAPADSRGAASMDSEMFCYASGGIAGGNTSSVANPSRPESACAVRNEGL